MKKGRSPEVFRSDDELLEAARRLFHARVSLTRKEEGGKAGRSRTPC